MDRLLERALNSAYGAGRADDNGAQEAAQNKQLREDEQLRRETAPMSSADAIKRIALAWQDKDYFRLLQLPYPEADDLGRATWACTASDVSKAYRRLSVLVHPDKNPGEAAREAFERLNEVYRTMRDPGKLEQVLKDAAGKACEERDRREARASVSERVEINARRKDRSRELRKQEGQSFQDEILQQVKARQEEARRKRSLTSQYRRGGDERKPTLPPPPPPPQQQQQQQQQQHADHDEPPSSSSSSGRRQRHAADGSDSEEERQRRREALAKKRRKPNFI